MSCNLASKPMKHPILTMAVAAGIAMTVSAPAWALDLTVYGVGHLSADGIDLDTDSSGYVHSNSSRLGFKGSHDLGNGFAVLYQFESGVDLTGRGTGDGNGGADSDGQLFTRTRDSFVGVQGGFGAVMLGRVGGLNQWLYDYTTCSAIRWAIWATSGGRRAAGPRRSRRALPHARVRRILARPDLRAGAGLRR